MKPALERTAILSRDITEQPEAPYVVFLMEAAITLKAHRVDITKEKIRVYAEMEPWGTGEELIATFPSTVSWLMVKQDRVDVISREVQIRRMAENSKAETDLAKSLGMVDEQPIQPRGPMFDPGHGQYL